ncbi:MAG: hypothetical protein ABIK09_18220 [Pseudomonadota bacterium]
MPRRLVVIPLLLALLAASAATAQPRYRPDKKPKWQDKYLSIGMGLTGVVFHRKKGSDILGPSDRLVGTFSLQTGIWYLMGDLRVSTDPSFDFGVGGFFRVGSVGPGWLVLSPLLFFRLGEHELRIKDTSKTRRDPVDQYGGGLRLEYLLFRSTLGFFVEARQTFHDPLETTTTFGVSWSPLMFLELRDRWE